MYFICDVPVDGLTIEVNIPKNQKHIRWFGWIHLTGKFCRRTYQCLNLYCRNWNKRINGLLRENVNLQKNLTFLLKIFVESHRNSAKKLIKILSNFFGRFSSKNGDIKDFRINCHKIRRSALAVYLSGIHKITRTRNCKVDRVYRDPRKRR